MNPQLSSVEAALFPTIAAALRVPKRMTVTEWAAMYRRLSDKSAAEPGKWDPERVPYLNAIQDALDEDDPCEMVVFPKSSQVGGSTIMENWIGWGMHNRPAPMLMLYPSLDEIERNARRFDAMVEDTWPLRNMFPGGRKGVNVDTIDEKHFPGGVLYRGSANVPQHVAGKSVRRIGLDDCDRMTRDVKGEGNVVALAKRRSAGFQLHRKMFLISSPTTEETSIIWPLWLTSTMGRYHVPCPHCGHEQYLRWTQLKWLPGRPETAGYLCEKCAAFIEERAKKQMLAAGSWKHEHPERGEKIKGFHINALYSPVGIGDSWAANAEEWEAAEGEPGATQVFFNTRLGEVVKSERRRVQFEEIQKRAEPYALRSIPPGILQLDSGSDVQKDRIETQVLGFGRDKRVAVIDYVVHYGDTTREEVWGELDEYLARPFENAYGVPMRLTCSLVDAGYLTPTVIAFTRDRRARGIFASRGSNIAAKMAIGRPSYPDTKRRGKIDQRGAEVYEIGVSMLKHWLYATLTADGGTADKPVMPEERQIHFTSELNTVGAGDYFRQLVAEVFDPKHGWLARANWHRNEALDTFVLAKAASMHHIAGVNRMHEADWLRLEQLYQPRERSKAPAAPLLGVQPILVQSGFLPIAARTK